MRDNSNQQRYFRVFALFRYCRLRSRYVVGLLGHDILLPEEVCVEILICRESVVAFCAMRWFIYGHEGASEGSKERLKEAEDYT